MRLLVTGAGGQVGYELTRALAPRGVVHALDRAALDLADAGAIAAACRAIAPGLSVNAAAYTAVDRAESEPVLAEAVNGRAPGILAREAGGGWTPSSCTTPPTTCSTANRAVHTRRTTPPGP